jgi:hypothetical protein
MTTNNLSVDQINLETPTTILSVVSPSDVNTELLIIELILTIAKNFGITNINASVDSIDDNLSLNMSIQWVKKLINLVTPLYTKLIKDQNINTNTLLISLVNDTKNSNLSNDIINLINLKEAKLDIQHIAEITNFITDLAALYNNFVNKSSDVNMKQFLTKDNIITFLTIILYVILFLVNKENLSDNDIQWIDATISCLKFTSTIISEFNPKFKFSDLFKCCK